MQERAIHLQKQKRLSQESAFGKPIGAVELTLLSCLLTKFLSGLKNIGREELRLPMQKSLKEAWECRETFAEAVMIT